MFRFFINSIKSCRESITGPEEHTQIESILEQKVIKNALKYIFLTRRWIKERIKPDSTWSHWLHLKHWVFLPKIGWVRRWSKGAVLAVFVSIVLPKRARWPPFFITFLSSPRLDTTVRKFSSEIYVRFFYQGITLIPRPWLFQISQKLNLIICFVIHCFEINTNKPIVTLNTVYFSNREDIALGNHALFLQTAYTLVSYLLISSR